MKRFLPYVIVAVVALITVGSGFALYRSMKLAMPPPATASKDGMVTGLHVRGPKSAPVTIEEFGDFQCPPCAMMSPLLKQVEEEQKGKVRVVFRHFPLAVHENARAASLTAEAAEMQGKFWEMHDLLYKEQMAWSKSPEAATLFSAYATTLGLDLERFNKDLQNPEVIARVDGDHKLGSSRGVTSTPTLFVNNVLLPPDKINPAGLAAAIESAMKEKTKQ